MFGDVMDKRIVTPMSEKTLIQLLPDYTERLNMRSLDTEHRGIALP